MAQIRKKKLPVMVNENWLTGISWPNFQLAKNRHDSSKSACHIQIDHIKTYRYISNLYEKTSFLSHYTWQLTSYPNTSFLRGVTHSAHTGDILWGLRNTFMWNMTSRCLGPILPTQFTAINDLTYDSLVCFSSTGHSLNLSFEPSSSVLVFYNI